jgi:hypothetical protein
MPPEAMRIEAVVFLRIFCDHISNCMVLATRLRLYIFSAGKTSDLICWLGLFKNSLALDVTPYSLLNIDEVSEEHTASIFRVYD